MSAVEVNDIVRVARAGKYEGRYGRVATVDETSGLITVEFEEGEANDDFVPFNEHEVSYVRRGPFRRNPR